MTIFSLSVSFSIAISVTITMPLSFTASFPVIVIVTISTTWFVAPTFFSWPTVVPLSGSLTSSKRNYFIKFFFKIQAIPMPNLIKKGYERTICSLWCRYVFVYNTKDSWYKRWWLRTQLQIVRCIHFLIYQVRKCMLKMEDEIAEISQGNAPYLKWSLQHGC